MGDRTPAHSMLSIVCWNGRATCCEPPSCQKATQTPLAQTTSVSKHNTISDKPCFYPSPVGGGFAESCLLACVLCQPPICTDRLMRASPPLSFSLFYV